MLTLLYGTETGTARDMAERIAALAVSTGFPRVQWHAMDEVPVAQWPHLGGPVIFVCSTTGQGDTPATMLKAWDALRAAECPRLDGLLYAVFGLGDSTYAKYNYQAKMLHNRLRQLGAEPLVTRGLGDESDGNGHDEELVPWLVELWPLLAEEVDPTNECGIATMFKKFKLEQHAEALARPVTVAFVPNVIVVEHVDAKGSDAAAIESAAATVGEGASPRFDLTISKVTRLTADTHFQNVSKIDFERPSNFRFAPTDSIGFLPANPPEAIAFLTKHYGNPFVTLEPNTKAYVAQPKELWEPFNNQSAAPLDHILRTHFDLNATARRALFTVLAQTSTDPEEVERFTEIAITPPEYDRFCWREKRTTVEVLSDFPHLRPPLSDVLSVLPRMTPRYYSIASDPAENDTVSLCVALLEFKTPMRRLRYGTCSKQLIDSAPGQTWRGCLLRQGQGITWPNRVSRDTTANADEDSRRPAVIVIGPGTGIAPCRALWSEAMARRQPILIFTGNRDRTKDFLFGDELEALVTASHNDGPRTNHPAFSRETPPYESRYVQHAMVRAAEEVAAVLRDPSGVVFISGNSKRMPQDVEDTLITIIENRVEDWKEEPKRLLAIMKAEGRYVTDTWS
jgi:NADPH-ferrihemoprotein reductase